MLDDLVCPVDGKPLKWEGDTLVSQSGRRYPVVEGIPVLMRSDLPDTLWVCSASFAAAWEQILGEREDTHFLDTIGFSSEERRAAEEMVRTTGDPEVAVVNYIVAATSGNLYHHLQGQLSEYPIPKFHLSGNGETLLDVGCNWGRWTIAAAHAGFRAVGLDPSLGAVLAAKRLCKRLGVEADFVVGDARSLPFRDESFDVVHSYSVIQHFARPAAHQSFAEFGRVLAGGGYAFIQMPNRLGVRCLYHQVRRRFRDGEGFDVRYWSLRDLRDLGSVIGPTELEVGGFFGLGVEPSDLRWMNRKGRIVIRASEAMRHVAQIVAPLIHFADSVYLRSSKAVDSHRSKERSAPAGQGRAELLA